MPVQPRRRLATLFALLLLANLLPASVAPAQAVGQFKCLGAPADEPAGGMYPEPRIFIESQSWWTQTGEAFPGRHIHTGACVPWLQPVDGVVQYHVRNLLHNIPGTVAWFRLQVNGNGPDPTLQIPLSRSCDTADCTAWDSFTVDYTNMLPGRWEHRFTHNIYLNAFGQRQFTTTRWHICIRTCTGGGSDAYTRSSGAAGWYEGLLYANAYLDPDDYIRLRDGVPQGQETIKVKFDQGAGSISVDPDAHHGNPGIVQCRIPDKLPIGGLSPVPTGTNWFQATLDTSTLSPGIHKLALRGSNSDARGVQEGVLLVPFRVLATGPQAPTASFTLTPKTGEAPLTVSVNDTSTNSPTGWTWDFGDGSDPVQGPAPAPHTYDAPGDYTVKLTATNDVGSDIATSIASVKAPAVPIAPTARFDAAPIQGVAPLQVTVTDHSDGLPTNWSWDFGDSTPAVDGQNPGPHTYADAGTYTITLTATNDQGSDTETASVAVAEPPAPTASFTVTPARGPAPLTVNVTDRSTNGPDSWTWDWGDSTTDTGPTPPAHTYTQAGSYIVTLTAKNAHGSSSLPITVTVDPPAPLASFTVAPQSGSVPLDVAVTDTSTGNPTSWSWDFGDGSAPVTAQQPGTHRYAAAGTYTITLTAGTAGGTNQATRQVVVNPPRPVAAFTVSPSTGPAPLSVTVSDRSTGTPTSWAWDFGDNTAIVTAQNPPAHVYSTPGAYTIKLTASNSGGPSSATMPVTVTVPKPVASFTATPLSGTAPLAVSVTDTSTGSPTSWSWSFGDGSTAVTSRTPAPHTYSAAGTYTITLTATNAGGFTTATQVITVNPVATTRLKDITFDPTLTDAVHGADRTSGTITRDTTTPLGGGGSARITNTTAYVEESFTATDDLYGSFLVRLTATPTNNAQLLLITNGGTTQGNLVLLTTRRLRLRIGSTTLADSPVLTVGTTYIVGFHQKRGTGSNGIIEAWLAPAGSALGSPFARRTTGTWKTAADRVRLGATDSIRVSVLLDNVLLDRASMPTAPAS